MASVCAVRSAPKTLNNVQIYRMTSLCFDIIILLCNLPFLCLSIQTCFNHCAVKIECHKNKLKIPLLCVWIYLSIYLDTTLHNIHLNSPNIVFYVMLLYGRAYFQINIVQHLAMILRFSSATSKVTLCYKK